MKKQRGSILVLELVGLAILCLIFAMSAPAIVNYQRLAQRNNVVALFKRVQFAELQHVQLYSDGYRSPSALSATPVTFPAKCEFSGLLPGSDALGTMGSWTITFTGTGSVTANAAKGCTVGGYTSFTLTAKSADSLEKTTLYLDNTLVIRFAVTGQSPAASNLSPPWTW